MITGVELSGSSGIGEGGGGGEMTASFQQQIIDGGVVVVALVLQRFFGFARIDAQTLHQSQDLLVGLALPVVFVFFVDDVVVFVGGFGLHPPVVSDLPHGEPFNRVHHQHLPDQRFTF